MAAADILDNFEWPHLRNGSRSTYIARIARSFAIAQLSCIDLLLVVVCASTKGLLTCTTIWYRFKCNCIAHFFSCFILQVFFRRLSYAIKRYLIWLIWISVNTRYCWYTYDCETNASCDNGSQMETRCIFLSVGLYSVSVRKQII